MRREGTRGFLRTLLLTAVLLVGFGAATSVADDCNSCLPCHGNFDSVHSNFDHAATPGSGAVVLFEDDAHDDGGWVGDKPYFDVAVDCALCHHNDLPPVHGNHCATCHPTPYDTLGIWGKGCQQGGCHSFYHTDATKAHLPFENASSATNDCSRCHDASWAVPQSKCLNCHAAVETADVTPPTTTSDVQDEYVGPARIGFSITDNGKVGVGRTFYQLDGGPATAAGKELLVSAPGAHDLDFWSTDQYGNMEPAPNHAFFTIVADTTPPVTTSDAKASYNQGGVINLAATDASTLGVKATFYSLNGGAAQSGTKITIPLTSGTVAYTLTFWSEDWAGNVEPAHTVNFTVTSGTGTLRLVWGNSDATGSPCGGDPDAAASWTVKKAGSATVVSSGSSHCPGWSGIDNVIVPIGPTPYLVLINYWDSSIEDYDQASFPNTYVTTPGQVVRLGY